MTADQELYERTFQFLASRIGSRGEATDEPSRQPAMSGNRELATLFEQLAAGLEIEGESSFRITGARARGAPAVGHGRGRA